MKEKRNIIFWKVISLGSVFLWKTLGVGENNSLAKVSQLLDDKAENLNISCLAPEFTCLQPQMEARTSKVLEFSSQPRPTEGFIKMRSRHPGIDLSLSASIRALKTQISHYCWSVALKGFHCCHCLAMGVLKQVSHRRYMMLSAGRRRIWGLVELMVTRQPTPLL